MQIIALHLRIPDPPSLSKSEQSVGQIINLAVRLLESGMLKADWDPGKHPRWPAGSAGGIGGEFAPVGEGTEASASNSSLIPVQEVIPFPAEPFEFPIPRMGSPPSEVLPPPIAIPQPNTKDLPKNPYPRNPRCVEEWAEAQEFCERLRKGKKLGGGDDRRNRGFGKWMSECIMGRVSEECGGNSTTAFAVTA